MNEIENMTKAEWQVMRIIWTLGESTSKQVIDVLEKKTDWKQATIKTLIVRLHEKEFLKADVSSRPYVYHPEISEDDAIDQTVNNLFDNLCCMKKGEAIGDLIGSSDISKNEIQGLIEKLENKKRNAPEQVKCDCLEESL
ncbi:CopY/TcrY family copper transport repressor [Companilactobacillus allii]|uniref:Uracil phosphoribosyltransferase n=1 Tax=Companilactobacillus allii TaxID=1847728 RepID=A0A1P8Q353_9LACO|nr:CopY/TcrY family copper transport repressor [Companilactobacillus allii]APX72271.1 uracil phosphoribosyltransferase [Companilactobacillus allii]USQ69363.1 CopY/TcrY family copper transport repressor [Companilactobacillus allii]